MEVSDGRKWWADGASDGSLHASVFASTFRSIVTWKVSDLSGNSDLILAEGNCLAYEDATRAAEGFMTRFLTPDPEIVADARRRLLALVDTLTL